MSDLNDLRMLLDSRYPIVVIETWEELRALDLIRRLGMKEGRPVFAWTSVDGMRRLEFDDVPSQKHTVEPDAVLGQIRGTNQPGIYALCDIHPFLKDEPKNVRLLKEIALHHERLQHSLVLISHQFDIPPEIRRYSARFTLSMPDEKQLEHIVQDEARRFKQEKGERVRADRESLDRLIRNLRGLSVEDARKLARGAILHDGAITEADLPEVNKAKFALMEMDGVLSYEYDTESFANVGGLQGLKRWLGKREKAFHGESDIDSPRGVMLVGVQGGGKSLAAKSVAGLWGLPLLRLDMGAIYNKFFGESERNVREALKMAETMSPCVLWIDEIEKGIAVGDNDGGTSRRVLGTLLTWMAENQSKVFMVATANDIERLPPELIRKGRLDEIFFVDLPDAQVREVIFRIHLGKRGQRPEQFDLPALAVASDGFTGAEIEQAVVAGLYSAGAAEQSLDQALLEAELAATVPLSVTMAEPLARLRHWCQGRAVNAGA
ncbi:AAA family ATPase [Alcanivorax sp. DP30]|uniref:AAA family ATPase n=1 Tax=Alcanivorax sp. DP30 TaxID=2606217 RepID=UPI0013704269|nr:AAA family ATPase [Alcanivorax sp. DP30]MZR63636.1 AAA family ATPase [Alcanivorax sp. DP30]